MFRAIQYIGNKELLKRKKTLFVCSKRAPWGTYERIFGWVESLTEKDVVVCCNTSELEVEVMKSLVVNQVSTILVVMNLFREENNVQIQKALKEGRMLVVIMKQTDKKRWSPRDRNFYLINQVADHIVGGYIDKYGSLFPLLVGKKNLEALTHNLVSDIAAEPDNLYQRWTVGGNKRSIAIECKWRQKLTSVTMMELFASDSLITSRQFAEESHLPVFIVLGIDGDPCEPNNIYIIPLEKAFFNLTPDKKDPSKLVCEPSQLNTFKRAVPDAPLCFDEFRTETFIPSQTSKEQQPNYIVEARKEHPNAYKPWTSSDDEQLTRLFQEGKSTQELCNIFGRKQGGIRSRLQKLGLT